MYSHGGSQLHLSISYGAAGLRHKPTYLHTCIARTCIPSTSSLGASRCGSLVPCELLLFPLHWCKACSWTWWPPATSPPVSHRVWSAAWSDGRAMSQSRHLKHWEEQRLIKECVSNGKHSCGWIRDCRWWWHLPWWGCGRHLWAELWSVG